jgi:hypothetical protein
MPKLIAHDPLGETEIILQEEFYGRGGRRRGGDADGGTPVGRMGPAPAATASSAGKAKPTHYKIVCISLYTEDIARLEALVSDLKRRGHTKANKSAVIRYALESVDIGKMPKGY